MNESITIDLTTLSLDELDELHNNLFIEYLDKFEKDKLKRNIKQNFYISYSEILQQKLEYKTKEIKNTTESAIEKINYLAMEFSKTNIDIWKSKNSIERKLREIAFDITNKFLEELKNIIEQQDENDTNTNSKNLFQYYPDFTNKLFNKHIYIKKEFNNNKIPRITSYNEYLKKNTKGFKKTESQKFVKNYISNNTPYNGILLWHGVGVGKTCAGISIAENFRDYVQKNNKKIIILTPGFTLETNWRDEIFNLNKELNDNSEYNKQCTGTRYFNELTYLYNNDKSEKLKRRQIKRVINKYYEFYGYQKLASEIEKEFKQYDEIYTEYYNSNTHYKKNAEYKKLNYIKERFSDTVIIFDEAHITRTGEGGKDEKKVPPYLELIARYAENTKFIMLSATPMYNVSKEIIWLINLLLLNDKAPPIEEFEIFENDNDIKIYSEDTITKNDFFKTNIDINNLINGSTALKIIANKSRGYISYLRGEDPFKFPLKIFPTSKTYTPNPIYDYKNDKIPDINKIPENRLILYKNEMSIWQFNYLYEQFRKIPKEEKDWITTEINKKKAFGGPANMASNIVYPDFSKMDENDEPSGVIGDNGLSNILDFDPETKQYTYKINFNLGNIDGKGGGIFHRDNIEKYSTKFKNIIDNIVGNKERNIYPSQGIVFIFSQYLAHGIEPISIMLEENGFKRYIWNDTKYEEKKILNKPIKDDNLFCSRNKVFRGELDKANKHTFKQARYIYLDGKSSEIEREKLVKAARGEGLTDKFGNNLNNIDGHEVLVILGSKVLEHGISFFNVRETHILEPWHHLNMIEQAAGRSIRNFSHKNLNREYQNVTLFLHSSTLPNDKKEIKKLSFFNDKTDDELNIETWDERIYRRAYEKKKYMSIIERVLKIYSIDCQLNKYGNIYSQDTFNLTQKMFNSKGQSIILPLYDNDFSQKCDYLECNYQCDWVKNIHDIEITDKNVNTDTYDETFARDDIDLAKEIIKFMYIKDFSYYTDDIVNYVYGINSNINQDYIFIALDELINNKEILYDRYYREGILIYRDNLYIFQTIELNNDTTPLFYRKNLLNNIKKKISLEENTSYINKSTIKQSSISQPTSLEPSTSEPSKFQKPLKSQKTSTTQQSSINIKILSPEEKEQIYNIWVIQAFGSINPVNEKIITDFQKEKNINLNPSNNAYLYITTLYEPWNSPPSTPNNFYPNTNSIIQMKVISLIDRLPPNIKKILFEFSLKNIIYKITNPKFNENEIDIIIYKHYSKKFPGKMIHSIFTKNEILKLQDLSETSSEENDNLPIYFRIISQSKNPDEKNDAIEYFYEFDFDKKTWKTADIHKPILNKLKLKNYKFDKSLNQSKICGFLIDNTKSSDKYFESNYTFKIINSYSANLQTTKQGQTSVKTKPTGASCGSAIGLLHKGEIIDFMNEHLYECNKFPHNDPRDYNVKKSEKKKSLCEELELILRYRESLLTDEDYLKISDKDHHIRFFYNAEESL